MDPKGTFKINVLGTPNAAQTAHANCDIFWMKRALAIARGGMGYTHPNPMVGAIVVGRSGNKISQGFHARFGGPHAEDLALKLAGEKACGATLYVTLEPCSHFGKTPPCLETVLSSGVKRVVIGCLDPNPKVASIAKMREAKIEVVCGVLEKSSKRLNHLFFSSLKQKSNIVAKVAIDRHGCMGHAKQRVMISSGCSSAHVMRLRAQVDAVLVGSGTWKLDDPKLNVRGKYADREPARVFLDPKLEFPQTAQALVCDGGPIILVADQKHMPPPQWMKKAGVDIIELSCVDGRFRPPAIIEALSKKNINTVLLEGGAKLFEAFDHAGLIDDWVMIHSQLAIDNTIFEHISDSVNMPELRFPPNLQSVIGSGDDLIWSSF